MRRKKPDDTGNTGNGGTQTEQPGGNTDGGKEEAVGTEGLQYQKRKDDAGNEYAAVVGLGMAWETEIVIPSAYRDLPVKEIGKSAFSASTDARNGALTSISIPDSVISIGAWAFSGCSGLTSIEIPNSVISIGDEAFYSCSGLTSIEIPNSVISIGDEAFYSCSGLTSVKIGNGVASIGSSAFWNCSGLTSITIPDSVTSIGYDAFYGCSELTSVTIGSGLTSIGKDAFYGCNGLKEVHISDLVAWCGIEFGDVDANPLYYARHLFMGGKEVTELKIPNSVTKIGEETFSGCSGLTSIDIPDSVTSIGAGAFAGCSGLAEIKVDPNNQTYHGKDNCLIETKSKTLILGCKTSKIPDDGSVTSIGEWAFYDCNGLTSVNLIYGQ